MPARGRQLVKRDNISRTNSEQSRQQYFDDDL
jgi:hypothetical protein